MIRENCGSDDNNKVFTFGIGDDASRSLVIDSARSGKGQYCFIEDTNLDTLKSMIIKTLQKASEPALMDCSFSFMSPLMSDVNNNPNSYNEISYFDPTEQFDLGQMFRN